jgi:hypothetical protein
MAATVKMTVFWVVAPCSLVEIERCLRGAYFLRNVGKFLRDYAEQYLIRQSSSVCSMPNRNLKNRMF